MWDVLQKETAVQKGKAVLRADVADAVRRLWKVGADGRIPAWAPGTTGPLGTRGPTAAGNEERRDAGHTGYCQHRRQKG
jgi:hypothetical protein